jgi:DNA-binding CsgD family transcriptional regulator
VGAALQSKDLQAALGVALRLRSVADLRGFVAELGRGLRELVPCDTLSFNAIDPARGTALVVSDPADYRIVTSEQRLAELVRQHPAAGPRSRGELRTQRLSELISPRALHRLELYQETYRPLGVEDQLVLGLPGEVLVAIVLSRGRPTFEDRDRDLLELVRPHLAEMYSQLRERERVAQLLSGLEDRLELSGAAVIQVDPQGRLAHASAYAIELLSAHLAARVQVGRPLPEPLRASLAGDRRPLTLTGPRGRLVLRRLPSSAGAAWHSLLLEEQRPAAPTTAALRSLGLSEREAQVARLVALGKRNVQVAHELGIREGTVRKHLERVYRTVGVGTRAELVARVLSRT